MTPKPYHSVLAPDTRIWSLHWGWCRYIHYTRSVRGQWAAISPHYAQHLTISVVWSAGTLEPRMVCVECDCYTSAGSWCYNDDGLQSPVRAIFTQSIMLHISHSTSHTHQPAIMLQDCSILPLTDRYPTLHPRHLNAPSIPHAGAQYKGYLIKARLCCWVWLVWPGQGRDCVTYCQPERDTWQHRERVTGEPFVNISTTPCMGGPLPSNTLVRHLCMDTHLISQSGVSYKQLPAVCMFNLTHCRLVSVGTTVMF